MNKKNYFGTHMIFLIFSFLCIAPVMLLISASLTSEQEMLEHGIKFFPKTISFDAYKVVFSDFKMVLNAYGVSVFITVVGTVSNLLMCALAAYPLSKSNFKYRNKISFFMYFTVLFSGGMVPSYILITQFLHLKDNLLVLILPLMASPWTIFLLRTYFRNVPNSLFEAAKLDGANEYSIFFKILLPLSKPALATAGIMICLAYWNDWYNAMLYINKEHLRPIQLMLQQVTEYVDRLRQLQTMGTGTITIQGSIPTTGVIAATCLIAAGPMLCVFMFFQKNFIQGLTAGAVKE